MQLILVRHAEAADIGQQGATSDFDRSLTELGHRQAKALAAAFAAQKVTPEIVVSSPLVRALQTAGPLVELIAEKPTEATVCELLSPDEYKPKKLAKYVADLLEDPVVLVGHNPSISDFARWLLDCNKAALEMDKGAAALIDCPEGPDKGCGVLRWLVSPAWFVG